MEMPPSMPSCGLKVFFASAAPSGTRDGHPQAAVPVQCIARRHATACSIILRGTRLMAAAPTGWSSPGFVTRPTPGPPSMHNARLCRALHPRLNQRAVRRVDVVAAVLFHRAAGAFPLPCGNTEAQP